MSRMRVWALLALLLVAACRETKAMELSPAVAPAAMSVELPEVMAETRADAELDRSGKSRVKGHVLWLPPSFQSEDGAFDLLIAFHAHRSIVEESVALAKLDAAVVSVNIGEGAGLYQKAFSTPTALRKILTRVPAVLERRGLEDARIRRVGLLSWSAGYGAMMRILAQPEHEDRIDAVVLLDGMHARRLPVTRELDAGDLQPFADFADRAANGEAFMLVTHNRIVPEGDIAGVTATSNRLLENLDLDREPASGTIEPPELKSVEGAYSKRRDFSLEAKSIAKAKGLVVRGFAGRGPDDHVAHLMAMTPLALEPLRRRWSTP